MKFVSNKNNSFVNAWEFSGSVVSKFAPTNVYVILSIIELLNSTISWNTYPKLRYRYTTVSNLIENFYLNTYAMHTFSSLLRLVRI